MTAFLLEAWLSVGLSAALLAICGWRGRRRRAGLRVSLHELRRPLQALALAARPLPAGHTVVRQVELASAALADMERTVNGGEPPPRRSLVSARALAVEARGRWLASAEGRGKRIELCWPVGDALVLADPIWLTRAIDNLLDNAIEHGGPSIRIGGGLAKGRVRIEVRDNGGLDGRRRRGRRGRGRGLGIVSSIASKHGGRFAIGTGADGAVAVLELPAARAVERMDLGRGAA